MAPNSLDVQEDRCDLFAPELSNLETAADIGAYLKRWHGHINTPVHFEARPIADILAHNTALVDAVLRRLFTLSVTRAAHLSPADADESPALTIVATGGYGRKELCPYSDVDVTFVPDREDDAYLNAIIKDMFQLVMDVFLYGANLKVGYAYRLMSDLGQLDHQTQTTLLDARYLCGDQTLFTNFRKQFRSQLLTADFLFQKWAERRTVLAKHGGDVVYGIEPNVKESAGGLRDIQNAEWTGAVRFHAGSVRVWPTLIERAVVSEADAAAILRAREFLLRVRTGVHLVSGEARDVLTAEKQEAVAVMMGYQDAAEVPAVESFMRDYYTQAAAAKRIARKVITWCLDSELSLGLGLASINRSLVVADSQAANSDTALPLHAAELIQAYGLSSSNALEEEIAQFLKTNPQPADSAYAGSVFTRLLTHNRAVADTLDQLEEEGVLAWILPEFGGLMTLIPYDAAHDYTVGAHSLRVVRNLEELKTTTDPKLADYHRVAAEISLPEVLYLAGLIHDIGKQWQGHHAETGAVAAGQIADRFGWDKERRDKLVFLVKEHLLMAEISRLRDLALEETIRDFTKQVPDIDALNMLYLLTYADTNAVGVGVWSEVKGKFLSELYYRSEALMSGGASPEAPAFVPNLARQRERIRKQLAQHNLPMDLIHEHTRNLPAQYLLNTSLEEMYLHIAMISRLRETFQPIVDFKHEYGSEYTEMTICTYDDPKPGLLAKITGVLYAQDINVHVAQVFTREASVRIAIDTLWVDYRGRPLSSAKKAEVQENLRRVLMGEIPISELLEKRKKSLKEQTIYTAKIDDAASERFSLLEVGAPDEKGVVFRLSRAISELGWNIHAARLSVWGSRARDAFYITDAHGVKVPAGDVERLLSCLPIASFVKKKRTTGSV